MIRRRYSVSQNRKYHRSFFKLMEKRVDKKRMYPMLPGRLWKGHF